MREIKFRAWDKIAKPNRMKSWEQLLAQYQLTLVFTSKDFELMQSTGLKDKNGIEVYVGDILKHTSTIKQWERELFDEVIGEVTIEIGMTYLVGKCKHGYLDEELKTSNYKALLLSPDLFEVIGDIHSNPELLEGRSTNGVDRCVMCGEIIPEGSQVCWKCKARIDKCTICKNKDKGMCLAICDHWRYKKYETKKM